MNTDRLKEVMANHARRMREDKERGFLETFQSSSPEDADFKREWSPKIYPLDDFKIGAQILELRKKLTEAMTTYCRCGRAQRYIVGERTFQVGGQSITLDEILYAYCDICESAVYSYEVAGEIEHRLKTEFHKQAKIPRLEMDNGKVTIDTNDEAQVRFFNEFKKD